jgi:NAD kinase
MKVLIVAKHSKYEWERKKFNLSHEQIVHKYSKERANLDAILQANDKQKEARDLFSNIMNADMVMMDAVEDTIKGYDLVVVLGGDNSFTKVSHFINNDTVILGVNSDPDRSDGHLLPYSITDNQSVFDLCEIIDFEQFITHEWPTLEATLDGKKIVPATSEYFFGERQRNKMSRHILVYEGNEYEQKSSGIIITTGAGSTGWFSSANIDPKTRKPYRDSWLPELNTVAFTVTEPFNNGARLNNFGNIGGYYGEEITLYSLNDDDGMVSVDSWEEYGFQRGSEAKIKIGKPLNVVVPIIK